MVSFHAKGGAGVVNGHVQLDLGNQLRLHQLGFEAVRRSGTFARTPIVITEADPDGCAACPATEYPGNAYRNSPAYGAYEVAMMKHSLELAEGLGVNLRGVLTWAFTFPGTPYFAGYRVLATNGIHLPVLNAFKLLGRLGGTRLPATSSGARPLDELLANGVRGEPDIDVLAARDGEEIQILVWNYHDDLLDADPAPVTLEVTLPEGFGTRVAATHARVDDTHGNAYAAWVAQGSPAVPSAAERAELERAMAPAVFQDEREANVTNGTVTLSFELPRFGLSLVTLAKRAAPAAEPSAAAATGCSCDIRSAKGTTYSAFVGLFVALVSLRRRRRAS
jgi:xylan 1,4-beta-xylosidase